MACISMTYIVIADTVMVENRPEAYIGMACIVMTYTSMTYTVMAYTLMAQNRPEARIETGPARVGRPAHPQRPPHLFPLHGLEPRLFSL